MKIIRGTYTVCGNTKVKIVLKFETHFITLLCGTKHFQSCHIYNYKFGSSNSSNLIPIFVQRLVDFLIVSGVHINHNY